MRKMEVVLQPQKKIALIAHDARKQDLLDWVEYNRISLEKHYLFGTGSTGKMVADETGLAVTIYKSGPLGGDQQIGSKIAEREIDFLIFFWDPLEPQPHEPDIRALLRLAVLYNIPTASNRATADFLISSPLMNGSYTGIYRDYGQRLKNVLKDDGT
jgi:methylglyoxal synthase